MKCNSPIDPLTGTAIVGIEREQALRNQSHPRCSQELSPEDVFCPACGAKVERLGTGASEEKEAADGTSVMSIVGTGVGVVIGLIVLICRITGAFDHTYTSSSSVREYNRGVDAYNKGLDFYKKGDYDQAVKWCRKMAADGNEDAKKALKVLGESQ